MSCKYDKVEEFQRNLDKAEDCKFKINLRNLLCMAENIFEDAPEVVKKNCKVM